MAKVRKDIDATAYAGTQLWLSEWSSDSPAMIAHVVKGCLPYCYAMSQWSFTNVFEEIGVPNFVLKEGDNGWGIIALGGIPKPAFNTYKLMHQLGTTRLKASDGPVLATRTDANRSAIVCVEPGRCPTTIRYSRRFVRQKGDRRAEADAFGFERRQTWAACSGQLCGPGERVAIPAVAQTRLTAISDTRPNQGDSRFGRDSASREANTG